VTVEVQPEGVLIEVRNWGDAIPDEMQQVIFNPLVQLAAAESAPHERPSTSMGLGLFIAREIVNAHGGSISVSSSAAAGTAFTIRLYRA
jgi:signal transduction histidine kinase